MSDSRFAPATALPWGSAPGLRCGRRRRARDMPHRIPVRISWSVLHDAYVPEMTAFPGHRPEWRRKPGSGRGGKAGFGRRAGGRAFANRELHRPAERVEAVSELEESGRRLSPSGATRSSSEPTAGTPAVTRGVTGGLRPPNSISWRRACTKPARGLPTWGYGFPSTPTSGP